MLWLLKNHSEARERQQHEPTHTEIAFTQVNDNGPSGFGNRRGKCHLYEKPGHHAWECPDKESNIDWKKGEEEKKSPASTPNGRNNKTINATHGSEKGDDYDNEDDYDDFNVYFTTVETTLVTVEDKLNLTELEEVTRESKTPIKNSWVILENQSTVNCFRDIDHLKNLRQVDKSVKIRSDGGIRATNWQADFNGLHEQVTVWWDKVEISNMISLKKEKKFSKIKYDSEKYNGFVVTNLENGSITNFR